MAERHIGELINANRPDEQHDISSFPYDENLTQTEMIQLERCANKIQEIAVDSLLQVGSTLVEAKNILRHGSFREYVERRCGISIETGQRAMRAYRALGQLVRRFQKTAAYRLTEQSTPPAAVEAAKQMAESGGFITAVVANRLIEEHTTTAERQVEVNLPLDDSEPAEQPIEPAKPSKGKRKPRVIDDSDPEPDEEFTPETAMRDLMGDFPGQIRAIFDYLVAQASEDDLDYMRETLGKSKPKKKPAKKTAKPAKKPSKKPAKSKVNGFKNWWPAVHRKVGKDAAEREYPVAVRKVMESRACSEGEAESYLLERMEVFASSAQASGEITGRLHPATWLRQGRYSDDQATWNDVGPESPAESRQNATARVIERFVNDESPNPFSVPDDEIDDSVLFGG